MGRVFIGIVGNRPDHAERQAQLVADLGHRRTFHFHRHQAGQGHIQSIDVPGIVDELVAAGNQAAVDARPATLSAEWHRIAREELGFDGVAVTDDLGMLEASGISSYSDPVANAVAALAAGNDLLLSVMFTSADSAPRIVDGIVAAVDAGTLPPERLREAATRVAQLRLQLAADGRGLLPCGDCPPVG